MSESNAPMDAYLSPESELVGVFNRPTDAARHEIARLQSDGALEEGIRLWAEAEVWRAAGDPTSAAARAEEALSLDRGSPLAAAISLFLTKDEPVRTGELRELVRRWPSLQRPRLYLGIALGGSRHYAESIPHLREATRLAPQDLQAWFYLGHALRKTGHLQEAAEAAHRVDELAQTLPWKRYAAHQLFLARRYRQAWAVAWRTSRAFPGLRARLLPWTLPTQVSIPMTAGAVAGSWTWLLVNLVNGESGASVGVPLAISVASTLVLALSIYGSGTLALVRSLRDFRRSR